MPLKSGKSPEIMAYNIKELMKAGHPKKQALAIALNEKRKAKKMAEGGEVLLEVETDEGVTMEPAFDRSVESAGPALSDARDIVDSGTAPKPMVPSSTDKGSPEHKSDAMELSPELKEILRKRKKLYTDD